MTYRRSWDGHLEVAVPPQLHWEREKWAMSHGPEYGQWYVGGFNAARDETVSRPSEPAGLGSLHREGWRDGCEDARIDEQQPIAPIR